MLGIALYLFAVILLFYDDKMIPPIFLQLYGIFYHLDVSNLVNAALAIKPMDFLCWVLILQLNNHTRKYTVLMYFWSYYFMMVFIPIFLHNVRLGLFGIYYQFDFRTFLT